MYQDSQALFIQPRFKLILIATVLVHLFFISYKLGGKELIISTGQITKNLSVKILLQEAVTKPVPTITQSKIKKKNKKVIKKKEKVEKLIATPSAKPKDSEVIEQAPTQNPKQAFESLIQRFVQPNYPRLALRRSITGAVVLNLFIKNDGSIEKALIAKSSGHQLLDDSALSAVKQWKFRAHEAQRITMVEKRIVYKIN